MKDFLVLALFITLFVPTLVLGEVVFDVEYSCPHNPCIEGDEVILNVTMAYSGVPVTYKKLIAVTSETKHMRTRD